MLNYLYYKMYCFILKSRLKDAPAIGVSIYMGFLISLNLFEINTLLAKLDVFPVIIPNAKIAGISTLLVMIIFKLYYSKKRYKLIFDKYSQESKRKKLVTNIIVILYAIFTCSSSILLALYKPGYLPKLFH